MGFFNKSITEKTSNALVKRIEQPVVRAVGEKVTTIATRQAPIIGKQGLQILDRTIIGSTGRSVGKIEATTASMAALSESALSKEMESTAITSLSSVGKSAATSGAKISVHTNPKLQENVVETFIDRAQIDAMFNETIALAQESVQIDMFVFGGKAGLEKAQKIIDRHRQLPNGLKIEIMVDPGLGHGGPTRKQAMQVVDFLKANGVEPMLYDLSKIPTPKGIIAGRAQIDHNKLIVVDNQVAIVGGVNFFDFGINNHDIMMRIRGPLAEELNQMMHLDRGVTELAQVARPKQIYNYSYKAESSVTENALVRLTKTDGFERSTKERLLENIANAEKRIYIAMLEFSDRDVVKALAEAKVKKPHLDIRVIMDPKNNNAQYGAPMVPDGIPNIMPATELMKRDIPVRWYTPTKPLEEIHMKAAMFDDEIVMQGSTNFTTQALETFRETGVELQGEATASKLQEMFLGDWARAVDVPAPTFGQRLLSRAIQHLDKYFQGFW